MRPSTTAARDSDARTLAQLLRSSKNLDAAWRQVRANAERSQSIEIRNEAREFDSAAASNLKSIQSRLGRNSFVFKPAKGIAIRRKGKKSRPIVVAPIESRIVQRALLNLLQQIPAIKAEITAGFNFGGVPGEGFGVPAAIAKAVKSIRGSGYYIRTDIKSFFVDIPRATAVDAILSHVEDPDVQQLFRDATKTELEDVARLGEDVHLFPLDETGVAQGSALSPLLCNYLLRDFDRMMNDRGVVCIRYIDDFILFARSKAAAFAAFRNALAYLRVLGLEAYDPQNPEHAGKAHHGTTNQALEFLGCSLTKSRVRPSKEKVRSLEERVEAIFDECIEALSDPSVAILSADSRNTYSGAISAASNVIRGWGNTYSFCNDDQLMRNVDLELDKLLVDFQQRFRNKMHHLSPIDRRRAIGLFLLADCNKDDDAESARAIASTPLAS